MPASPPLTLEEFREKYPWPAKYSRSRKRQDWLWNFDLKHSPEALWPYFSDTARTNRAAGLAEMHYREQDGVLHGWHRTAGLKHDFTEHWQWIVPTRMDLVREYQSGFANLMRQLFILERHGSGTRFYAYFGWVPRGVLGPLALRVGMSSYGRRFRSIVDTIGSALNGSEPGAILREPIANTAKVQAEVEGRLSSLREELSARGASAEAVGKLIELASVGDELELDRIRIPGLARDWGMGEHELLVAALHSTRAGLLNLTWDVMCPHCRGVRQSLPSLGDVPEVARCEPCAIDFDTQGAQAIEVTFRVHPSVRRISDTVYCSAQPLKRAHIYVQQELLAGEKRQVQTSLAIGEYRLRRRGEKTSWLLTVDGEAEDRVVRWSHRGEPEPLTVAPGPEFQLDSDSDSAAFVVEEPSWDRDALSPATVFGVSEFRDLFSEEYLASGVQLDIGEQTLLFTDIVGSTNFYARAGDPAAFVEVRKHFQVVFQAVADNQGAVVKTIGDAVMASFANPLKSLDACAQIHRAFPGPGHGASTELRLRISLHRGPCIAVNLNSGIDYFGGTVNIAAKLQACADAGQVAVSAAVLSLAGARERLQALGGSLGEDSLDHSGLGTLELVVWTPPVSD